MFAVGEQVCLAIDKSKVGVVINVQQISPTENQYQVFHDGANINTYFENQLLSLKEEENSRISFSDFCGRYAANKMRINSSSTLFSLNAGKIKFIPFQFRPLARILKAERPRILIADEVGVGKTIETGIILKEFEKRDDLSSVLVVCPKDLTSKWRIELKNKFDESFEILTPERLRYCFSEMEAEGIWPFECRKCIVGLELLRRDENIARLEAMEDWAKFDMLIVDEAHHIINRGSKSHQVVEYFCSNSDVVVFLSATPLQLGSEDLFSLLNLLEPEEFIDKAVFGEMTQPNKRINSAIRSVRNISDPEWQSKVVEELQGLGVNEWATATFKNNSLLNVWIERLKRTNEPLSDSERISCLRDLESLHTFSNIINRTKRKDIGEFTIREPISVMTTYNPDEQEFYNAVREFEYAVTTRRYGERVANLIMSTLERQITSSLPAFVELLDRFEERGYFSAKETSDDLDESSDFGEIDLDDVDFQDWVQCLKRRAKYLPPVDSKVQKLLTIVNETVRNTDAGKLLVFSFFKRTLKYLRKLIDQAGFRVETITGETPSDKREEFRARFRLPKENSEAIDVLLCSEVGCEGLDYEFCNRLVNYDIPWNPMKIEQRIGRVDRFGQKSPKVQIYNFITEGTVEERIYHRCFDRLGVFNSTLGDLESVLGDITKELNDATFDLRLTEEQKIARAQQLTDNAIRLVEEQRRFENASRELFLLDVETNDSAIVSERSLQIQWQIRLVQTFFNKACPNATCAQISPTRLKIRMFKTEKQELATKISSLKKSRKIDRNSRELANLEKFLLEDVQTTTLNFDANDPENDKQGLLISATHPLTFLALNADENIGKTCFTSCRTFADNGLKPGKYLFACYEWNERGYRQTNEVKALVYDLSNNQLVPLSLDAFERVLLSAEDWEETSASDLSLLDAHIFKTQQEAKAKLARVNEDVVSRKISTLDEYYKKQIERQRSRLETKSKKIQTMVRTQIEKLENSWREKKDELEKRLLADILVKNFASGTIEVM